MPKHAAQTLQMLRTTILNYTERCRLPATQKYKLVFIIYIQLKQHYTAVHQRMWNNRQGCAPIFLMSLPRYILFKLWKTVPIF